MMVAIKARPCNDSAAIKPCNDGARIKPIKPRHYSGGTMIKSRLCNDDIVTIPRLCNHDAVLKSNIYIGVTVQFT